MSALLLALGAAAPAYAQVPVEQTGAVEVLRTPLAPHTVWASDGLLGRMALADLETGRMLGMIDGGFGLTAGLFSRVRPELYVPETHYSRGSRGVRTDVLTLYDAVTLAAVGEVEIPPKRAMNPLPSANAALSDDGRFVAVFNLTPASSLSIVDVERRSFAGEIETPGCGLVYAAGARRFAMLCADGVLLSVRVDERGREVSKERSQPFFDAQADPVTEKGVRHGQRWLFASFEGMLHTVDFSEPEPRFEEPWSLLSAEDRAQEWRIGGRQHLAVHEASGRLYSLVHQGGRDTHKDMGTELWVYDLARRERVQRIAMQNPGLTFMGVSLAFGQGWIWPFHRLYDWLLSLPPARGIGEIAVTQDDAPLLVTGAEFSGSLGIYDAMSGELLRRLAVGNMTTLILQVPWETVEATR